jgi:hypothetical protein
VDLDRNCHGQNPLAVLVLQLDCNLAGVPLRQAIPPDLSRSASSLVFGGIQAGFVALTLAVYGIVAI